VHSLSPSFAEYFPAGQESQETSAIFQRAPWRADVPAGQLKEPVQSLEMSPVLDPYLPAEQRAQTLLLAVFEDETPASAYFPAGQVSFPVQAEDFDVRPTPTPNVPAGQGVHAAVVAPSVE
jgi:hypothetical protein